MTPFPLWPEQASTFAATIDALYIFLIALTGTVSLAVAILVIGFAVRYRRRDESQLAEQRTGHLGLELLWIVVPLALFMIPFAWGAATYMDMAAPPKDALEITILARQWMWKAQHPDGQREIDTLHVPAGRPVRLRILSQDVIHSFFVPAFRVKADAVPGRYTSAWFTATKPGTYHLFCAEYCGFHHAYMRGTVVVMEEAAYAEWLSGVAGAPSLSPAAEGEKLFAQLGCQTCHRADSLRAAPVLAGLYGSPVRLTTGQTIVADDDYLRESILDPTTKVVMGFQPIMPPYAGRVSEEQIVQLIAYIRSLNAPSAGRAEPSPR